MAEHIKLVICRQRIDKLRLVIVQVANSIFKISALLHREMHSQGTLCEGKVNKSEIEVWLARDFWWWLSNNTLLDKDMHASAHTQPEQKIWIRLAVSFYAIIIRLKRRYDACCWILPLFAEGKCCACALPKNFAPWWIAFLWPDGRRDPLARMDIWPESRHHLQLSYNRRRHEKPPI